MKSKVKLRKLNVQISLYFLISVTLIIALLGTVLFYSISTIIMNDSYKDTADAIKNESYYLTKYLERITDLSNTLSTADETIDYLKTNNETSKAKFI